MERAGRCSPDTARSAGSFLHLYGELAGSVFQIPSLSAGDGIDIGSLKLLFCRFKLCLVLDEFGLILRKSLSLGVHVLHQHFHDDGLPRLDLIGKAFQKGASFGIGGNGNGFHDITPFDYALPVAEPKH